MKKQTSDITEADIQKAIKYLELNKGKQEATRENAIKLLQGMQITAHVIAHDQVNHEMAEQNLTYKSFLMGASQITDDELLELGIEIMKDDGSSARKLIIPAISIEKYKELIRSKLDLGFWNDFVGEDKIYFIFKMSDGEIKEYEYSEEERLQIAALCTKLNNDPIEKTSNLLKYLAENDFYTEKVESYQRNLSYT